MVTKPLLSTWYKTFDDKKMVAKPTFKLYQKLSKTHMVGNRFFVANKDLLLCQKVFFPTLLK
jgi:hypothetical protein